MALSNYSADRLFSIQKNYYAGCNPPITNIRKVAAGKSNYSYFLIADTGSSAWGRMVTYVQSREFTNPQESLSMPITADQVAKLEEFAAKEHANSKWLMYFVVDNVTTRNGYHLLDIELGTMRRYAQQSAPGVKGGFLKVNPKGDYYWNLGPGGKYIQDFRAFHQSHRADFGFSNGSI